MQFPAFDLDQFRRRISRLNQVARHDACTVLGVSPSTLNRWLAGRQRVPWATWCLVHLLVSGDLGGIDRTWSGWSLEDGQLVHGHSAYAPAQIASYDWFERQNRNLVAQLAAMQDRRVPIGTEQAQFINATQAALDALIDQVRTSQAMLGACLSNEKIYQEQQG